METQRLRLLRHVARLVALVAFLSFGPLGTRLPRWARELVIYLLRPAEDAANGLVQVMARLIAHGRGPGMPRKEASYFPDTQGLPPSGGTSVFLESEAEGDLDHSICTKTLLGRLAALKDKLENLQDYAERALLDPTARPVRRVKADQPDWLKLPVGCLDIKSVFGIMAWRIDPACGSP